VSRYQDLTSELLTGMRLYGVKYQRIALHAPFGLQYEDAPGRAQLHFVGRGSLLIRSASGTLYPQKMRCVNPSRPSPASLSATACAP